MPKECSPRSTVTVEQLDESTWIVRRQGKQVRLKRVLIPVIEHLPAEREWEKIEAKIGRNIARRLPEPKE